MFQITPYNKILLTLGDTAAFTVEIVDDEGKAYIPAEGDILKLVVYNSTEVVIEKEADYVDGAFVIALDSEYTEALTPGYYDYKIVLLGEDDTQYTVIIPSIFELMGAEPSDIPDEQDDEKEKEDES